MIDIDRFSQIVNAQAEKLPEMVFFRLNLGIGVMEHAKLDRHSQAARPLYVLGEYRVHQTMGRGILIYYGSFRRAYPHLHDETELAAEVQRVLNHELTHHLESLAGAKDLEIADARSLIDYMAEDQAP